jgi:hypothetical protein
VRRGWTAVVAQTQLDLARFLVRGRRIDSDRPPVEHAQYVVFWDDEVPRARPEIEALLADAACSAATPEPRTP